jgi:lactate racemase
VSRHLLVSGYDVRPVTLPEGAQVLRPPMPFPALADIGAAVARALEEPVAGPSFSQRLTRDIRITVVVDDFSFPAPPSSREVRGLLLEGLLAALRSARIPLERVTLHVANGASRKWRPAELTEWLGPFGARAHCHDLTAHREFIRLGELPQGPLDVHRALIECDLLVHLNVVTQPLHAGLFPVIAGASGLHTLLSLEAPRLLGIDLHQVGSVRAHGYEAAATLLASKVPVVQLSCVLNNDVWPQTVAGLLDDNDGELSRPLSMWNALPSAVRNRAARLMRTQALPWRIAFGPPEAVAPKTRAWFLRQHEVTAQGEADVLVFGVPGVGPYSIGALQNPLLATHLALGLLGNLTTGRPLLREGGALILANPLTPEFEPHTQRAHQDFYERCLKAEREPAALLERFLPDALNRNALTRDSSEGFGFHPAHPYLLWAQCEPLRRRAGRVLVAHGDPRVTSRFGFSAAPDVESALAKAQEFVGGTPRVRMIDLPPPFFVRVE